MDVGPLAIFLVKNGSNGDKMLFKYPFESEVYHGSNVKNYKRNPYSLGSSRNGVGQRPASITKETDFSTNKLCQFVDEDLSHLLGVNRKLCGDRFELKINDVRFVGHPVSLEDFVSKEPDKGRVLPGSTLLLFNIVFALKVNISHDIVNCYHDLSRRLGIALSFEERRCHFLSNEAKIMLSELDEQTHQPEADRKKSVFQIILSKSLVAKHLKKVFTDLSNSGRVCLRLNNWIDISFSLPQTVSHTYGSTKRLTHEMLMKGLEKVKPYHTMLLLYERQELFKMMSDDVSPALRRLLDVASPINPFYTLAADADLTLPHVLRLAGHLVYWGMATIIYPVCNTNIYVLSPHVPTHRNSKIAEMFQEEFPGCSYHLTLGEYSLPISLLDLCTPMCLPQEQQLENRKLLWLLKRGLLQQLHTYIYIIPQSSPKAKSLALSGAHSSVRGILAPVAEDITEKNCEETDSSCSSFKEELDWQDDMKDFSSRIQYNMDLRRSSLTRGLRETLIDEDQYSQDSNSSGAFGNRKLNLEDGPMHHLQNNSKIIQQAILSQSLTPSESEFGSVCSDDRSLSPSGTSQITGESVLHDLDLWLSAAEKEMVLNVESSKNLEDLKQFTNLCRYFRGEHHMEDIMYRANIPRSQLLEILDKFRSALITVQTIDPNIYLGVDSHS